MSSPATVGGTGASLMTHPPVLIGRGAYYTSTSKIIYFLNQYDIIDIYLALLLRPAGRWRGQGTQEAGWYKARRSIV